VEVVPMGVAAAAVEHLAAAVSQQKLWVPEMPEEAVEEVVVAEEVAEEVVAAEEVTLRPRLP
jgi:hypothetical protein